MVGTKKRLFVFIGIVIALIMAGVVWWLAPIGIYPIVVDAGSPQKYPIISWRDVTGGRLVFCFYGLESLKNIEMFSGKHLYVFPFLDGEVLRVGNSPLES